MIRKMKEESPFAQLLKEASEMDQNDPNFQEVENDVGKGHTDKSCWNYSFHEFLHYVQENIPLATCRVNVANVLKAHIMRNPSSGYVQGMNLVASFLLCFMDEEHAFWMFTHLVENVLPPFFYSKTEKDVALFGYHSENYIMKNLLKSTLELRKKDEISNMESFLDMVLPTLMLPLLCDILSVSGLYFIWNEMIKQGDFTVMQRAILTMLKKNKEVVLDKNLLVGRKYKDFFCNDITAEFLQIRLRAVTINPTEVVNLRKEYEEKSFEEEQTKRSYKPRKTIVEGKSFSKAEIELLQSEYQMIMKSKGGKKTTISREEIKMLLQKVAPGLKDFVISDIGPMKLFDVFDVNQSGEMEHGDFLAFSALLMKAPFEDKMLFCFKYHDKTEKNYLTPEEFSEFLDTVARASLVMMHNEVDPFVFGKVASFKKNMNEVVKSLKKVKYVDVQEKMMADPLIIQVSQELEGRRRKSTALITAPRMTKILKGVAKEEIADEQVSSDGQKQAEETKNSVEDQSPLQNYMSSMEVESQNQPYLVNPGRIIRTPVGTESSEFQSYIMPQEKSIISQISAMPAILYNNSCSGLLPEDDEPTQDMEILIRVADNVSKIYASHEIVDFSMISAGLDVKFESNANAMDPTDTDNHSMNFQVLVSLETKQSRFLEAIIEPSTSTTKVMSNFSVLNTPLLPEDQDISTGPSVLQKLQSIGFTNSTSLSPHSMEIGAANSITQQLFEQNSADRLLAEETESTIDQMQLRELEKKISSAMLPHQAVVGNEMDSNAMKNNSAERLSAENDTDDIGFRNAKEIRMLEEKTSRISESQFEVISCLTQHSLQRDTSASPMTSEKEEIITHPRQDILVSMEERNSKALELHESDMMNHGSHAAIQRENTSTSFEIFSQKFSEDTFLDNGDPIKNMNLETKASSALENHNPENTSETTVSLSETRAQASASLIQENADCPSKYPENFDQKISDIPTQQGQAHLERCDPTASAQIDLQSNLLSESLDHHSEMNRDAIKMPNEPGFVSANIQDYDPENEKIDSGSAEEEAKIGDQTNFIEAPIPEENDNPDFQASAIKMQEKISISSKPQENVSLSQPVELPCIARNNPCDPLEPEEEIEERSMANKLYALYRSLEEKLSHTIQSHVEALVLKIQDKFKQLTAADFLNPEGLEDLQFNLASKYHRIAGQTSKPLDGHCQAKTSETSPGHSASVYSTQNSTHQTQGTQSHGITLQTSEEKDIWDQTMRISQTPDHQADVFAGVTFIHDVKAPSLQKTDSFTRGSTTSTISTRASETSLKGRHDSVTPDDETPGESLKHGLMDQFEVIEEEEEAQVNQSCTGTFVGRTDTFVGRTESEIIEESYSSLLKESFIRDESPIFTDMKTASKAKVAEVRAYNRDKEESAGSCKGCIIF